MAREAKEDQDKHGLEAELDTYIKAIQNQLHKHDVLSIIMTGLAIDRLAEKICYLAHCKPSLKMI